MGQFLPAKRISPNQSGVTLVELMIGLAVGSLVVAAAFSTLTMSQKAYRANEQVVDMQQNVRMAMELLSRDVKLAGFGSPGVAIGNCTSAIVPADQNSGGVDSGPDSIQLLIPTTRSSGDNRWTLRAKTASTGITQLLLQTGGDGAVKDMEKSGLTVGSYISIGGSATAKVTGFDASAQTINVSIPPPLWFQQEDPIYLLQCIRYQVVSAPDPGGLCLGKTPCLTRGVAGMTAGPNAEAPIAEGIEDLQLAYACDGCVATINSGIPDGIIDDQIPFNGKFDQNDFLSDGSWAVGLRTPDKIQLVQIALVARQSKEDHGFGDVTTAVVGSGTMQVTPDHTVPADPNHRRRVLRKTVETRNVGL
ncbi:MAG: PilW family protein [Nitrospira sp.]|nr:PilW family protein [Nitrospira sp.]